MWCEVISLGNLFILLVFVTLGLCDEVLLNVREGSQCTWQQQQGVCTNVYKCLSAVIDAKNGNPPPVCLGEPSKPPTVCCTDCGLVPDFRELLFDKRLGIYATPKEKSQNYCLKILHELDYPCKRRTNVTIYKVNAIQNNLNCSNFRRLVRYRKNYYTRYTWKEELTHLAMLGYGMAEAGLQWLCGGTLISDRFVLTAAHCIDRPDVGTVTHVGLGERTGAFEHWHQYRVTRKVVYPEYEPPSMYHDIALLRTEIRIIFHFWVMPACLPQASDLHGITAMAAAIGNYTSPRSHIVGSYFVQLQRFSESDCKILYPPSKVLANGFNSTIQLCYGYKNRLNMPCGIDSGAPLQWKHPSYPCGLTVIGVTSFDRSCKYRVGFGLYTNVSYYVSWIESVVWPTNVTYVQ